MLSLPFAPSPESLGLPSAALAQLVRELDQMDTMHTMVVLRHGQVALAMSWAPFGLDDPHILHSLSKSFTSMAVGLAQAEGRLDIDRPFLDYLPEYAADATDPRMLEVKIRHLLAMSSGHTIEPTGRVTQPEGEQDWVRAFVSSPLQQAPGSVFLYNSLGSYVLAAVVRRVTGLNVREYLMPRLFEPLGIMPGQWERCPAGTDLGGWGFMLSVSDLATVGQLLLQGGRWQGRQLLPPDYLAAATRFQADNSANTNPDWKLGYGYQFWMSTCGYRGDGAFGQYILVLPEYDMVVATTACLADMQRVLTAIWKVRGHFAADPLPEAPGELAALRQLCASRVIRPFAAAPDPAGGVLAHGRVFRAGDWSVTVDANPAECLLSFWKPGCCEQLRASFLAPLGTAAVLKLDDITPHAYRAIARRDQDGNAIVVTAVALDTGWVDTYRIGLGPEGRFTRSSTCALGLGWLHRPAAMDGAPE